MEGVHLVMGVGVPREWAQGKYMIRLWDELSRRLGFTYEYHSFPSSRLALLTDSGEIDGDMMRVYEYGEDQENLIRVPTPFKEHALLVYSRFPDGHINKWRDLKNYRVVVRRGVYSIEKPLTAHVAEENIVRLNNLTTSFTFVGLGRADAVIVPDFTPLVTGESRPENIYFAGMLNRTTLHIYLHKSHAEYVPLIDRELRRMEEEGFFDPRLVLPEEAHPPKDE